jgi:putative ABC transport system permease protein
MSAMLRQFRRAPGRILASVFALALAVGAMGVLAIPHVSEGSLHAAVGTNGLGDIIVPTTPLDADQLARIAALPNVSAAEGQAELAVTADATGSGVQLVGLAADRTMNLVPTAVGRQPASPNEVVVSPGLADAASVAPGDRLTLDGTTYDVVGIGETLWWAGRDTAYAPVATVAALATDGSTNRLAITAVADDDDSLRAIIDDVRAVLAPSGDTFTDFPVYLPDGTTPIDADIRQISTLIGMLGIMAGVVALILLASTTNTLITERTREVAVMRALGGRQRPLRRRLRRIALAITAIALVIGLPLGVGISNLIARMVLEKFVGITPGIAVDWRVLVASAAGMLLGARLVAARAARRVTNQPLAAALRDREGTPFGRTAIQRGLTRLPSGGLFGRIAARASLRRPARTVAVVAQIAAAVGVAFLIPTLATSVNDYNSNAQAIWQWETRTIARDPGLPFAADVADTDPAAETAVWVWGSIDDWDIEAYGIAPDSAMVDPVLSAGRWFAPVGHEAVVSAGFADRTDIRVGDSIEVELAAGTVDYTVVGLVDDYNRTLYTNRAQLAADLGAAGMTNVVWSTGASTTVDLPGAVELSSRSDVAAADGEGRDAIVVIFGAIGVIVAGVAALAVMSSMIVSLFERRHELATLQALGARRRRLRALLVRELVPLGLAGLVIGLPLGALGARAIIGSFESSNAVDIGVVDATGAVPYIVAATLVALVGLGMLVVRSAARRPVAVTLRGAA